VPPTGGTTTIQGTFKTQWDVNTIRTSDCAGTGGGGGSGGSTTFYSQPTADNVAPVVDKAVVPTTRVAEQPLNAGSAMIGKIIKQLDIPLKKEGTLSGTVYAKIWSPGNAVIYTSPTTFVNADLTTSFVTKTFDFSTNTHVFISGDRVGIEQTAGTETDRVLCSYVDASILGSTSYTQYDSDNAWHIKDRELCCTMWQ